jgi:hypothetical protein
MSKKIARAGIEREPGYLYFVDKQGDISRSSMARGGRGSKKRGGTQTKKVARVGVRKEKGYLYFVDRDGDVARAKMVRR